jgi:uncharacterized protein (TIGR03435 family)
MQFKTIVLVVFLQALTVSIHAQTPVSSEPGFEVVSIRHNESAKHMIMQNGDLTTVQRNVEFKGLRLSGDAPLSSYVRFACSPLLTPYREEQPQSMGGPGLPIPDYYQIEAIAPAGTTIDEARAMLRKALAERLGFQYHLADREEPIFNLVRGSGALKLTPSTEADPTMESHRTPWELHRQAASMVNLAGFLSGIAGRNVVDKTGIEGLYKLDLDWNEQMAESMALGFRAGADPVIQSSPLMA